MKSSNHHFSYAIEVNSSRERAWQVLADIPNWKAWDTELLDAKLHGIFKVGAKGELTPRKGPQLSFVISAYIPYESYVFKTKMPVGWLVIKRSLKGEQGKILFTDEIFFTGFLKYLFGIFLGRQFKKVLPEVMNNFKRVAEQEV